MKAPPEQAGILPTELAERLKQGHLRLIDVREPHELQISHIQGAESIPLGQLASHLSELDSAQEMLCSARLAPAQPGRWNC